MTPNFFDPFGEYPEVQDLSLEEAARQLRDHVMSYRSRAMETDQHRRADQIRENARRLKVCEIQLCMAAMGYGA